MRRTAARQTHPRQPLMGRGRGRGGHGDARGGDGGWATGGEIFAKTAKTPPLQSGVARMPLRSKCRPIAAAMRIPCTPHATHLWGPIIFITTRRAASLQTPPPPICACAPLRHRMRLPRESPTSMSDPTVFVATRRAAARRVVILLHGSHLWGPYGFFNDAARRVATFFENLNCGIEISLPARRSPKND